MTFSLGDIQIDLIQKEIKNIHLSVMPPDGNVRIAAPLNLTTETIRLYAISKLAWIKKQQKKIRGQQRESKRLFINKETHYFQGRKYMFKLVPSTASPKIILDKTTIYMHISESSSIEKRQDVMNKWYRTQLKITVTDMISK
mgnify:FL=1